MAGNAGVIGLDFGTSTTLLARGLPGRAPTVFPLGTSTSWLPSLAGMTSGGMVFGEEANLLPAPQTIRSAKRLITNSQTTHWVQYDDATHEIPLDDVIVGILRDTVNRARQAGLEVHSTPTRLGCPAVWGADQRELLADAADTAGMRGVNVDDIVDEPIAAGIGWAWNAALRNDPINGRVLVFDFGGGTLDVAVMVVETRPEPEIKVLAAQGVPEAGDDLDAALRELLRDSLVMTGWAPGPEHTPAFDAVLTRAARRAKESLSTLQHVDVILEQPFQAAPPVRLHRHDLEERFQYQMKRAQNLVLSVLREARMRGTPDRTIDEIRRLPLDTLAREIDHVLLVGGMARVPMVSAMLSDWFPHARIETDRRLAAPEESVVAGLAFYEGYERLNLQRPGFDFVLQWTDPVTGEQHEESLYRAFTALYTPDQVFQGQSLLGAPVVVDGRRLPAQLVDGRVIIRSVGGQQLRFRLNGTVRDHLPAKVSSRQEVRGKLYADGRILLRDSLGYELDFRVEQWPVVRFHDRRPGEGLLTLRETRESVTVGDSLDRWRHK